ncbi:MAG TPA: hypothetical protein P5328_00530 [Candidatus Paceibacterota bacterium]|nr:hypothetical protein [Candidatus Paceibacterota bacterium]HRZ34193.1 hypothetical protein [Candidatus Paceibacterota bacterium]
MEEVERKIVKTHPHGNVASEGDEIKRNLNRALSEYDKVKKLVDYFVLGLLLAVIMFYIS